MQGTTELTETENEGETNCEFRRNKINNQQKIEQWRNIGRMRKF